MTGRITTGYLNFMFATNQFRKGLKIELDGVPYQIIDFQHISPGKGTAFTRTKLRNLLNQNVIERTFRSGEVVPKANTENRKMQYLYKDGDDYCFMDTENYEQIALTNEVLGENSLFLQESLKVDVLLFNERPIGVELPNFVELKIIETEPGIKGDTASGGSKTAKLETGAVVQVPLHLKEGEVIRVDTRDSKYVEKVNK